MSQPKKHHYVPVFYLERWTRPRDGRLTQYCRVHDGRVVTSPRSPNGVACEDGLNSLLAATAETAEVVETAFMSGAIDNTAAPALERLVQSLGRDLSTSTAVPLTYFLLSMRLRHPQSIRMIRSEGERILLKELSQSADEYSRVRSGTDPESLVELARQIAPLQFNNFGLLQLPGVATNRRMAERMLKLHWRVVDCSRAGVDLVTTDRPCYLEGDLGDEAKPTTIVFPASPRVLLLLSSDPMLLDGVCAGSISDVVKRTNKWLVQSAATYVYATGTHHEPLVAKYLAP